MGAKTTRGSRKRHDQCTVCHLVDSIFKGGCHRISDAKCRLLPSTNTTRHHGSHDDAAHPDRRVTRLRPCAGCRVCKFLCWAAGGSWRRCGSRGGGHGGGSSWAVGHGTLRWWLASGSVVVMIMGQLTAYSIHPPPHLQVFMSRDAAGMAESVAAVKAVRGCSHSDHPAPPTTCMPPNHLTPTPNPQRAGGVRRGGGDGGMRL